jgi:hypothetical protein
VEQAANIAIPTLLTVAPGSITVLMTDGIFNPIDQAFLFIVQTMA